MDLLQLLYSLVHKLLKINISLATHIACTTFSLFSSTQLLPHTWIPHTGATNHMCCAFSSMHNIHSLFFPLTVKFPNEENATVTHVGVVWLHPLFIFIPEVLLIPTYAFNILSISKLSTQVNSTILFISSECYLHDQY